MSFVHTSEMKAKLHESAHKKSCHFFHIVNPSGGGGGGDWYSSSPLYLIEEV